MIKKFYPSKPEIYSLQLFDPSVATHTQYQNHKINNQWSSFKKIAKSLQFRVISQQHKSVFSFACFLLIFHYLLINANCQCTTEPLKQSLSITDGVYCLMKFDPCLNYQILDCQQVFCQNQKTNCKVISQIQVKKKCQEFCCKNTQSKENFQNQNSLNFCSQNITSTTETFKKQKNQFTQLNSTSQSSAPSAQGIIIIVISAVLILLIIIGVCIRRRYRQNNQQANPSVPLVYASTTVDLNKYNLDTEGPYFVNSNESCAICLDNNVNLRTHCNHFYHANCLLTWLKKKAENPCPLCMGISYNPIKVYCKQCRCGDKLVNIQPATSLDLINQYDSHKCRNCKQTDNKSFILVQEDQQKTQALQIQNLKQFNQTSFKYEIYEEPQKPKLKSKRRHRKVQSLKKITDKAQKDKYSAISDQISTTNKKIHNNYHKTSEYI